MNPTAPLPKPRPIAGIDIRRLPIGPQDAFVLSRVDGNTTAREIGYATSLSDEQVAACLSRLESLGAIEYLRPPHSGIDSVVPPPPTYEAPPPSNTPTSGTIRVTDVTPLYDQSELQAESDLDPAKRREILDLFYQLEAFDHYRLLGVDRAADRKAVKTAYYEKVKTFHPDRYFGKNLGPFRAKLEACFARLTQAHDTLASASSREEYEAYLDAQRQTRALEHALSQTVTLDDITLLEQRMAIAMSSPQVPSPEPTPNIGAPPPIASPVSRTVPPASSVVPRMTDDERRRHLAFKLRASSASLRAPARTASSTPPASSGVPSRERIAEQLRRQLGASKREDSLRQVEAHLAAADAAMAANDPVAASNALRIAQSLAPNDSAIGQRLLEIQALAATALADTYLRQAEYEEKSERFEAAARSYERAARGKPSAATWEAAARCLLAAQRDLRMAGEYARQSIAMAPERAAGHLLLGQIFLAARMRSSAITELERARRLDPNNDTVVSLLKRIANDEF